MTDAGLTDHHWFYEMARGERAMRVARYLGEKWSQAMMQHDHLEDLRRKREG